MTEQPMDVGEWFVDGAWYRLPDGAILESRPESLMRKCLECFRRLLKEIIGEKNDGIAVRA